MPQKQDFGQLKLSNQQVADIMKRSKEVNLANGVPDINKVSPGWRLYFVFPDNFVYSDTVAKNSNWWNTAKINLGPLAAQHGGLPKMYTDTVTETVAITEPKPFGIPAETTAWYETRWGIFAIIATLVLLFALLRNRKQIAYYLTKRQERDLATDHPILPGGMTDENTHTHMRYLAERRGVTLLGDIVKGRVTTTRKIKVGFSNGPDKIMLNDEVVYRSRARRQNGTETNLYGILRCGNDGCELDERYVIFTPDLVQSPALQTANQPVEETTATNEQLPVFNGSAVDLANVITAIVAPMNGKDNGKLAFKFGEIKIEMEFSTGSMTQTLLVASSNGIKDQVKDKSAEEIVNQQ
jgi:hypothetical protein